MDFRAEIGGETRMGTLSYRHTSPYNPFRRKLDIALQSNTTGTLTPTLIPTGNPSSPTSSRVGGGQLAPNGNIYLVPQNLTHIIVIETNNGDLVRNIAVPGLGSNNFLGSAYWEGFIYFNPVLFGAYAKLDVREFLSDGSANPNYEQVTTFGTSGSNNRGVLIDNLIYTNGGTQINILDLATEETLPSIPFPAFASGFGYNGSVNANDSIYFLSQAQNAAGAHQMEYNLRTKVFTKVDTPLGPASVSWRGGTLSANGRELVYAAVTDDKILIFDIPTQTFRLSTQSVSGGNLNNYYAGALAADGRVYFAPWESSDGISRYTPSTDTYDKPIASTGESGVRLYGNGVLAPNNDLYFIPTSGANILKLNMDGVTQSFPLDYLLSSYNNRVL